MGQLLSMSPFISSMHLSWSEVSSNSNLRSKSLCISVSGENA